MALDAIQTQTIMPIEPPPAPVEQSGLSFFTIGWLLFAVLVFTWYWRRRRSLRERSQRKLRQVRKAFLRKTLDKRASAYEIAAAFCEGLQLTRLTATTPLPPLIEKSQYSRWRWFTTTLDNARYSENSCSSYDMRKLISEARYWLKQWP